MKGCNFKISFGQQHRKSMSVRYIFGRCNICHFNGDLQKHNCTSVSDSVSVSRNTVSKIKHCKNCVFTLETS